MTALSSRPVSRKKRPTLTGAQGHAHVDFFLVVKDFPQLDDVRVVQSLKNVHLVLFRTSDSSSGTSGADAKREHERTYKYTHNTKQADRQADERADWHKDTQADTARVDRRMDEEPRRHTQSLTTERLARDAAPAYLLSLAHVSPLFKHRASERAFFTASSSPPQNVVRRKAVETPTILQNLAAKTYRLVLARERGRHARVVQTPETRRFRYQGKTCMTSRSGTWCGCRFVYYLVLELLHPALRQAVNVD